jgi:NADH-quinone oxidoreductase subunit G
MSNQIQEIKRSKIDLNYVSSKMPVSSDPSPEVKPLPKITIDGLSYEFKPGDTIMEVAERYKIHKEIPRYCYHPGLPIAGTCRMCTVEVEKAPKLMTSCSTPAGDGMIVHTRSEKVLKSRNGVMDFLLTNHPLDCPVCDKAGECKLQDYNFEYGPAESGFKEEKRVFPEATTKKLSDKVTLNMNRCVHCERCVRFTDEVTKTHDLVMVNRGWHKELDAADERGLINDYQGCLTDFCPVGALTFNDFRFKKRSWFLDKKASICDRCSKGCNIEVHSDKDVAYRYMPIYNEKVNGHWMCDEGRVSYNDFMNPLRIISPLLKFDGKLSATNMETLIHRFSEEVKMAGSVLLAIGTDATNEEAFLLKTKMSQIFNKKIDVAYFNNTHNVKTSKDDQKLDHLLRMKDHTPNTRGIEELEIPALSETQLDHFDLVIVFRNGRAEIPKIAANKKVLLWGLWNLEEVKNLKLDHIIGVIPGLATIEKEGTFKNCDGITQRFKAAIAHHGGARSVQSILDVMPRLH